MIIYADWEAFEEVRKLKGFILHIRSSIISQSEADKLLKG